MTSNDEDLKAEVLPDDYSKYDLSFKMIIVGDPGVGKSCLITKASKGVFDETYSATLGFEFMTFNVKLDEKVIKLQIWDTCGQEIYKSLISSFYRNATLAMIVYSIDSRETFNNIKVWLKEIKLQSSPDIKIFLIGNKADLEDNRQVKTDEANQLKSENGFNYFSEASAKTGLNTQKVFIEAATLLYKEHLKYKKRANRTNDGDDDPQPIKVKLSKTDRKTGCC